METIQHELTAEERHERLVAFLKRHMDEKRRDEQETRERYKSDPAIREAFAKLKQENEERGTPVVRL
ncbi:hypothetical protein [Fibrella aquatilis]|uniref:Uncharacterized protein n=1 Tax=Fibrella aquatilis TaxID=2817059 RepID=A0A939G950_9BACT|nr:hypothetical protein [Fibrella aquatilis]MBO0934737.1 hypothetical protein [Fibrella aquatilis]